MIDQGTKELEEGNLEGAKKSYLDSIRVKETSGAWFNLGVSLAASSFWTGNGVLERNGN
jgi:hypothetical protein